MGKNNIELLSIAEKYLGQGGSVFRKYCGLPAGAAYCNAYVSYIFHEGDDSSLYCDGKKETYCPHSIKWCYDNLALIPMYLALPMDVLYFDWERNGVPNHIGFARKRKSCEEIYTIEGNTSGGIVANKTRTAKYVQAVFRPHFAAKFDTSKALVIDGYFGYNSIALLQVVLKKYGTYSGAVDGILGKDTVKGIQKLIKVDADGMWGPGTSKALQKFLGVKADSYFGPDSVKNLQAWINKSAGYDGSTPTPEKPKTYTGEFPNIGDGSLHMGDSGAEVEKLQKFLNWYYGANVLAVDGIFGNHTALILRKFQDDNQLAVDGYCGPATLAKMKVVCPRQA